VVLGDGDRERLFELLGRHAAAGSIGLEELERRVAVVDAAQTREQAAEAFADLPPIEPAREGPPLTGQRWPRWGKGHAEADEPAPEWRPTNERFRDPKSNRIMRVWVDPAGGRHYVGES
jgi:hypothetical protein